MAVGRARTRDVRAVVSVLKPDRVSSAARSSMKGCKLPQRPKKRAKIVQKTLLLVSPGTWLNDLSLERYEVREKKASKKRPRGLKAMGSMDSGDSE